MTITNNQIRQINALLTKLDLQEYKHDIIHNASAGRAFSTKELTETEAEALIERLNATQVKQSAVRYTENAGNKMRRSIMHICYMMHIVNHDMSNDEKMKAIDTYIQNNKHIVNKKTLKDYDNKELHSLFYQFDKMYKHYLNCL